MKQPITTFTCSIYSEHPEACRNYPFREAQITFDTCLFLRRDVSLETLTPAQQEHYCPTCGKCCYACRFEGENRAPVARCDKLRVHSPRYQQLLDPDTLALLNVITVLEFA